MAGIKRDRTAGNRRADEARKAPAEPRPRRRRNPDRTGKWVARPRNSPFWHIVFRLYGKRHSETTGLRDKRAAEKAARACRDRMIDEHVRVHGKRGVPDRVGDLPLLQAVDRFWAEDGHTDSGADCTRHYLNNIVDILGPRTKLSAIRDADVVRMIGVVEQYDKWGRPEKGKVGDDTVNSHVKLLSRLMNRAVDVWGFMLRDMPKWPRHKVAPDFRTREVTLDELVTLARVWREDLWPALAFLFQTGMRLANGVTLRWKDVDFAKRVIRIRVKAPKPSRNRKRRKLEERRKPVEVPITQAIEAILRAEQGKHPEFVFTFLAKRTYRRGKGREETVREGYYPLKPDNFRKYFHLKVRKCGIEDLRIHDLRRTRGSWMLRATGNIATVQRLLHHASVVTTQRSYAHVTTADVGDGMEVTDAYAEELWARHAAEAGTAEAAGQAGIAEPAAEERAAARLSALRGSRNAATSPSPRLLGTPANDNPAVRDAAIASHCAETIFRAANAEVRFGFAPASFQGMQQKSTGREASCRTSSELPSSLGGVNSGAIEGGEIVTHQGVRGRFKEIQRRVACRLDEAFEPTPLERLRKAGHTVWAFEPEDGSASDAVVVVGDRDRLAARAGAA